jgi:hypothetical protein
MQLEGLVQAAGGVPACAGGRGRTEASVLHPREAGQVPGEAGGEEEPWQPQWGFGVQCKANEMLLCVGWGLGVVGSGWYLRRCLPVLRTAGEAGSREAGLLSALDSTCHQVSPGHRQQCRESTRDWCPASHLGCSQEMTLFQCLDLKDAADQPLCIFNCWSRWMLCTALMMHK